MLMKDNFSYDIIKVNNKKPTIKPTIKIRIGGIIWYTRIRLE